MYAGPGSGPLAAAATSWGKLGAELSSVAADYRSLISGLLEGWLGPASTSMATAGTAYLAWLSETAARAEQAAVQATAAVTAYQAAFAATVPPPVIAANRSLVASLIATNFLGLNTPAIAATEAHYGEMWAQDAAAMYGYAASSATATQLTPFAAPPQTTNPAGLSGQAAVVAHALGNSAATHAAALSSADPSLTSAVPQTLTALAAPASAASPSSTGASAADLSTMLSAASTGNSAVNAFGKVLQAHFAGIGMVQKHLEMASKAVSGATKAVESAPAAAPGVGGARVVLSAGFGQAPRIGAISVPPNWAATAPAASAVSPAASVLPGSGAGLAAAEGAEAGLPGMPGIPGSGLAGGSGRGFGHVPVPRYGTRLTVMARPVGIG